MRRIISVLILIIFIFTQTYASDELTESDNLLISLGESRICKDKKQSDIPTIFIPGILASWYSEESYNETKIKRWIPDPITHSYDTLFYTFKQNGYSLKDVFYEDQFTTTIVGNPKQSLYLFGYDWKKDNKVTAKLLSNLVTQIRLKYEQENGCDIGNVNIIGHSMGGLVARAMLENICADEEEYKTYYLDEKPKNGELKKFNTTSCYNYTRVNQLITISTPHRGSPRSLPMWENGDIEKVEDTLTSLGLKSQLSSKDYYEMYDYTFDQQLYNRMHGYDSKIPNGIVTIGQLLPDLANDNSYNDKLKYIYNLGYMDSNNNLIGDNKIYLDNSEHPKNSFLEELNKQKNIDVLFSNVTNSYTSYYSKQTGQDKNNNIVGFELLPYISHDKFGFLKSKINISSKDIYDKYNKEITDKNYVINTVIKNSTGLGGDGTVPTNNLLLVANNTTTGKEVVNSKFQSIEMKCYAGNTITNIDKTNESYYNDLYKGFGQHGIIKNILKDDIEFEICSHTKTPIGLAVQVYNNISNNKIFDGLNSEEQLKKEKSLLLKYVGFTDYVSHDFKGPIGQDTGNKIYNFTNLENYYIKDANSDNVGYGYHPVIKDSDIENELEKIQNSKFNDTKIPLDFGSATDSLTRYEILSPINLIIEDEQGRKIGIDPDTGKIINEIPGAWTSGNTEGSGESEFFLIPKTGTGKTEHKIHSYGTGDGEYHIVMNEIKLDEQTSTGGQDETDSFVIAGTAKKGVVENYVSKIEENNASFKKIDTKEIEQKNNQTETKNNEKSIPKKSDNSNSISGNAGPISTLNETKKVELKDKYKDVLEKLYKILDTKYTQKKKQKLKQNLLKFKQSKNPKYKNNEKVNFLIDSIIEYVK